VLGRPCGGARLNGAWFNGPAKSLRPPCLPRPPRQALPLRKHKKAPVAAKPVAPASALSSTIAPPLGVPPVSPVVSTPATTTQPDTQPKEEPPTITKPEGEGEPPSVPHVQVSADEWEFKLSRTSVPAGKVVLEFVNVGQDEHNLNYTPPEGPSAEPVANTPSKGVADVTLQMQPGSYTLFCSLPTHEQKGMKATLTVE